MCALGPRARASSLGRFSVQDLPFRARGRAGRKLGGQEKDGFRDRVFRTLGRRRSRVKAIRARAERGIGIACDEVAMDLPPSSDPRWHDAVTGNGTYRFLALNLLLSRIGSSLAKEETPEHVAAAVEEVRALLERNAHLASVQHDLALLFGSEKRRLHTLMTAEQAAAAIASGRSLILAGDESVLSRLPHGEWIGGTTPYLMTEEGTLRTRERVFVTEVPPFVERADIRVYTATTLSRVYDDIPPSGYGVMIVPLFSRTQYDFALGAPAYRGFASKPLVGWVAGIDATNGGRAVPRVFDGRSGGSLEDGAVVMHVTLASRQAVEVGTVNVYRQGDGDALVFPEPGWAPRDVIVNGSRCNFASYLVENEIDLSRPFVGSYGGAKCNVGIRAVHQDRGLVLLWAPVFSGVTYRHAAPVADLLSGLLSRVPPGLADGRCALAFSCNCYSNYLHGQLEGKLTGPFVGPIVFGEIAYQLWNESLVYLTVGGS